MQTLRSLESYINKITKRVIADGNIDKDGAIIHKDRTIPSIGVCKFFTKFKRPRIQNEEEDNNPFYLSDPGFFMSDVVKLEKCTRTNQIQKGHEHIAHMSYGRPFISFNEFGLADSRLKVEYEGHVRFLTGSIDVLTAYMDTDILVINVFELKTTTIVYDNESFLKYWLVNDDHIIQAYLYSYILQRMMSDYFPAQKVLINTYLIGTTNNHILTVKLATVLDHRKNSFLDGTIGNLWNPVLENVIWETKTCERCGSDFTIRSYPNGNLLKCNCMEM